MDDGKKRACTTCARLKMKCRYPDGEDACSRCLRMKLQCHAPEYTPRKPRGKSTRVAQLEQKIDGLVSMLSARQPAFPSPESPFTPATANTEQGQTPPLAGPAADGTLELIPGFRLTVSQASHYLDLYRSHYMVNFPFVIIETTNALALYTHSPCLFWALMCAVAPETERINDDITAWFRKNLAERIIANQERNIELLQAILVYLEWCIFQFFIGNDGGIFLHLAHTIVDEMRLDKSVDSAWLPASSLLSAAWASMRKDVPGWHKTPHTPADRRAFLGFFHISSLVQSFFRRGPHIKWGEYVSECCDYLASGKHHEYDSYIVGMIRFQMVSERAARDFAEHPSSGPVMDMALLSAQRELEQILETMPTAVRSNELFLLHYHALVLRLYDPLLTTPGLNRVATVSLCRMFPAANNFFNTHTALSPSQLSARPFTQSALLAFYIVSVSNLVLYEAPGWDSGIARQHVDFAYHTAQLAVQFDAVDEFARVNRRKRHMKGCNSLYREYVHKFRWMNQWYVSRIADNVPEETVEPEIQWDDKFWEDLMFFQPIYAISDV